MHLFCRLPLVTLLHRLEVLSLGVRMRLLVRPAARDRISPGACIGVIRVPNGAELSPLSRRVSPCHHVKCVSMGKSASRTKENSCRAKPRLIQDCHLCCHFRSPRTGIGMLADFPFPHLAGYHRQVALTRSLTTLQGGLPRGLGPTYPCPFTVHTETFSASVFNVLN
jgi:hypothetical protein